MIDLLKGKEVITPNPEIAIEWTEDLIRSQIPLEYVEDNPDLFGELSKSVLTDPVRNTYWKYLYFKDSSVFSPAAADFNASELAVKGTPRAPSYCPYLKGTKAYKSYWIEQRRRCLEGYEPKDSGIRISGEYYFYLNFCRIKLAAKDLVTGEDTEIEQFPRFCSMDYYWFKELELRENPTKFNLPIDYKQHMACAKSRRKGFSFKNAAGAVWKYSFYKNAKIAIISQLGDKGIETFEKCLTMIDFLTENTEFGGPHIFRTFNRNAGKGAIKAGVKDKEGKEKGRKSEIYTISLHNRPDAASGAGCVRLIFEEAGMIKELKTAWRFAEPTLRSGKIKKGIAIIFGTGGDMDGATQDFADMFYSPLANKVGSYDNIYEEEYAAGRCGWFVDDMWFREGATFTDEDNIVYNALDAQGNAHRWVAEIDLNQERMAEAKGDKAAYNISITQSCKTPSEAFLRVEGNVFPVAELNERLTRLKANEEFALLGTKGELAEIAGEVIFKPDVNNKLQPIDTYPLKDHIKNREGCIIQYEGPRTIDGVVPAGAYIISIDPVRLNNEGGESLIAIYVIKTKVAAHEIGHDEIVMEYVGRPKYDPIDTANYLLLKMSKYYNAKITHENDAAGKSVRDFFVKNKEFFRLMTPPKNIVEKHISNSSTNNRKTGHSMGSIELKEIGEIYLKRWLLEKRGLNPVTGKDERNLDLISSKGLLEELISYNRERNCDRVLALMGCIIQMKNSFNEYVEKKAKAEKEESIGQYFARKADEYSMSGPQAENYRAKKRMESLKDKNVKFV